MVFLAFFGIFWHFLALFFLLFLALLAFLFTFLFGISDGAPVERICVGQVRKSSEKSRLHNHSQVFFWGLG